MRLCNYPLSFVGRREDARYSNNVVFSLHCHCVRPHSLRCWSAASFLTAKLQQYLQGAVFNSSLWWLRPFINWGAPTHQLLYLGGVLTPHMHYIYVQLASRLTAMNLKYSNFPKLSVLPFRIFEEHRRQPVIVFQCPSCAREGPGDGYVCARRVRRVIKEMYRTVFYSSDPRFPRNGEAYTQPNSHRYNERVLQRFHKHAEPLPPLMSFQPFMIE